jgi:hypothetical protein
MYLRMKRIPGGPMERAAPVPPPKPFIRPSLASSKPTRQLEKELLRSISKRQEQRWGEVLKEYRAEKHLTKGS